MKPLRTYPVAVCGGLLGILALAASGCAEGAEPPTREQLTASEDINGSAEATGGSSDSSAVAGAGGSVAPLALQSGGEGGTGGSSALGGAAASGGTAVSGGTAASAGTGGTTSMAGAASGGSAGAAPTEPEVVPSDITLIEGEASPLQAPSAGGADYSQVCPDGEVLIGYHGTTEAGGEGYDYLRSFEAVCGTVTISAEGPYTVSTSASTTLSELGVPGSVALAPAYCPLGEVLVGFDGQSGGFIDHLRFYCAPLNIVEEPDGYTLAFGAAHALSPVLGGPYGSAFALAECPEGQLAVGNWGRSGGAIDAYGLLCDTPNLVVE